MCGIVACKKFVVPKCNAHAVLHSSMSDLKSSIFHDNSVNFCWLLLGIMEIVSWFCTWFYWWEGSFSRIEAAQITDQLFKYNFHVNCTRENCVGAFSRTLWIHSWAEFRSKFGTTKMKQKTSVFLWLEQHVKRCKWFLCH